MSVLCTCQFCNHADVRRENELGQIRCTVLHKFVLADDRCIEYEEPFHKLYDSFVDQLQMIDYMKNKGR